MRQLLSLTVLLGAQVASAQTFTATVSALRGNGADGDRTDSEDIVDGFNAIDCMDPNAELVIEFSPVTPNQIDLWHNNGSSTDCSLEESRLSSPMDRECIHIVTAVEPDVAESEIVIPVADIVAGDPDNSRGADICSRDRTAITFWLLNSSAAIETGAVTDFGTFTVSFDSIAPPAPTFDNTDRTGNRVTLDWDAVSDVDPITQLRYFVEVSSGCPFSEPAIDSSTSSLGDSSATVNLGDLGIGEGESAAVRVSTVDQAGNVGEPSTDVCITRVTGTGPCDLIEGCEEGGCAAGGPISGGGLGLLAFALGIALRRGRR
ncbi:MAG: hypothetical protein AAGE52_16895 [Myxococcota bacterium]